jgi:hypothetical protein
VDFDTYISPALGLIANQAVNVELKEALSFGKALVDAFFDHTGRVRTSLADVQNSRLYKAANLSDSLVDGLLCIDIAEICVFCQVGHHLLAVHIVLLNVLGQDRRCLIFITFVADLNHALLTGVFRALKSKDPEGSNAVLNEKLRLKFCLREIFNQHTWSKLVGKRPYQMHNNCLIIFSLNLVL